MISFTLVAITQIHSFVGWEVAAKVWHLFHLIIEIKPNIGRSNKNIYTRIETNRTIDRVRSYCLRFYGNKWVAEIIVFLSRIFEHDLSPKLFQEVAPKFAPKFWAICAQICAQFFNAFLQQIWAVGASKNFQKLPPQIWAEIWAEIWAQIWAQVLGGRFRWSFWSDVGAGLSLKHCCGASVN